MATIGILVIGVLVLFLPLLVKPVGEQLEIFLFAMGTLSVTVTSQWSVPLLLRALEEPWKITAAVLAAGLLFHFLRGTLHRGVERLRLVVGAPVMAVALVVAIGLLSSVITAIIAALILVEIVRSMHLSRKVETRLIVMACFSIGLGAALTPIGEPLATIAISKLAGEPYHAGFWFLLQRLWMFIVPGIALCAAVAALVMRTGSGQGDQDEPETPERLREVFVRTAKVYLFVFGLVMLGTGFTPIIDRFAGSISHLALFWVNILSAVLDNATLTAAEIVPAMEIHQVVAAVMGLLIARGMLVPGNIPNIIAAGRLKIDARAWALFGLPVGLALMAACFVVLVLVG
jgi:predicted cation transporter